MIDEDPISHYLTDLLNCSVLTVAYCREYNIPLANFKHKVRKQWLNNDADLYDLLKLWGISISPEFTNFRLNKDFLPQSNDNYVFDPTFLDAHFYVIDNNIELDLLIMELTGSGDVTEDDIYIQLAIGENVPYRVILVQKDSMSSVIIDRANNIDLSQAHRFCFQGTHNLDDSNLALTIEHNIQLALTYKLDNYLKACVELKEWVSVLSHDIKYLQKV